MKGIVLVHSALGFSECGCSISISISAYWEGRIGQREVQGGRLCWDQVLDRRTDGHAVSRSRAW